MIEQDKSKEKDKALEAFRRVWSKYRESRDTAMMRARMQVEAEMAVLRAEAARQAHQALMAGNSKRRLGLQVMGTADYRTVQNLLDEVQVLVSYEEAERKIEAAEALHPDIVLEKLTETTYAVTLTGEELEQAKARVEWPASKVVPTEASRAEVTRANGVWTPLTGTWLESVAEQHPVVAWVSVVSNRARLEEIAKEQDAVRQS